MSEAKQVILNNEPRVSWVIDPDTGRLDWLIDQMENCSGWVSADGLMEEATDLMAKAGKYDGEDEPDMAVFKQYMRKVIDEIRAGRPRGE